MILFIDGLNTSTGMAASTTILQTIIPDGVRGRVFTLLDVTWAAMRLVPLGLGGLLAHRGCLGHRQDALSPRRRSRPRHPRPAFSASSSSATCRLIMRWGILPIDNCRCFDV